MARWLAALLLVAATSCARPVLRLSTLPDGCSSWPALPMSVAFYDEDARDYEPALSWAAAEWDREMGREAFVFSDGSDADVLVVAGVYSPPKGAEIEKACRNGRVKAVITMHDPYVVGDSHLVAAHELGHALGLGHSQVAESIMYPRNGGAPLTDQPAGPGADFPPWQRILARDAQVANDLHPR